MYPSKLPTSYSASDGDTTHKTEMIKAFGGRNAFPYKVVRGRIIKAEIYLWAVLIGIDEYQAAGYKSLEGAVADANDMEDYLYKELYVPKDHINVLRNSQATRKGIISAIEALNVNPDIKVQDPILIYFAGHGCALDRPEDWTIGDSHIQGIVPHDMNTAGPDGKPIPAIPDYTISALLGRLASVKGDNITVIFDCCHSGSGTRNEHDEDNSIVRCVDSKDVPPLPADLDKDILDTEADIRGKGNPNGYIKRGLLTHVLLAACAPEEEARETNRRGDFTAALLGTLRSTGAEHMTYKRCIHLLPKLARQHPQCEGYYINRRMFDSRTFAINHAFIKVQLERGRYILEGGAAQGITLGSKFEIYESDIPNQTVNPPLGTARVTSHPQYFTSDLETTDKFPGSQLYALQIEAGPSESMRVHFTEAFSKRFKGNADWDAAFCSTKNSPFTLVQSTPDAAQMIVDVNEEGKVTFETGNPIARSFGLSVLPNTAPLLVTNVLPILRAAAKWAWHVERSPGAPLSDGTTDTSERDLKAILKSGPVEIEFLQVELATGTKHSNVVSNNHNVGGVVDLKYNQAHFYGIKLVNNSSIGLYPYLFYFDVSEQSIVCIYKPPVVKDNQAHVTPLRAESQMEIGYGTDGWNPLAFEFEKEQQIDVAILRLFISTTYLDLDSLELTSPFGPGSRGFVLNPQSIDQKWGVTTMGLVVRR